MLYSDAVKLRVDEMYPKYLAEATRISGSKIMCRITFVKLIYTEMFEESDEKTQEYVRKRMKDDSLDMPDYLLEAQETIGEEDCKRYFKNYRRQM